jgi:fatty acid-binding protein DegV
VPVHVLDSGTTSLSLGFAVLSAARAAGGGAAPQRVIDVAERRFRSATELIYVDTLEYLRRGGRIGAAQAMLGSAFSIKPSLPSAKAKSPRWPAPTAAGARCRRWSTSR